MAYKDIIELVFVPRTEGGDTRAFDNIDKSLQKVDKSSRSAHRSLMELGMTTWFLSIATNQITNSMKMFAQGNELATAKINLLQQSIGSMTYGFYAMTHMTRMALTDMTGNLTKLGAALGITSAAVPALSLGVGALFAIIAGIVPVIAQWNNQLEEAYGKMLKTASSAQNLFKAFYDSKNILEAANALQQIRTQLGDEFVEIVRNAQNASQAYGLAFDLLEEKMIKAWLQTKEGKQALQEIKNQMIESGEGVTVFVDAFSGMATYIYDNTILIQKLKEAYEDLNSVPTTFIEKTNEQLAHIAYLRGEAYEKYLKNIYGKIEEDADLTKFINAYQDYLMEIAKLQEDENKQFELNLQKKVDYYKEAGLSMLDIERYVALARAKYQEELTNKEIEEVFKREQAEWDALTKEKQERERLEAEKENIRNSFLTKYKSYLYSELELTKQTLSQEVQEYIKAGGDMETARQVVEKVITEIVMKETEKRISELEREKEVRLQNLEKEKEGRLELYNRIIELGNTETQNEIMGILLKYEKYKEYIKDTVLLETWKGKELQAIWQGLQEEYTQQVEELNQRRLDAEAEIDERIIQLKENNLEYQAMLLQKEIEEYYNAGVAIEKIQEYASLRIVEIKEQETDAWLREEERKLKAFESFQYAYQTYLLQAEGRKDEISLLRETRDAIDLARDAIELYGEDAWQYINEIIARFPDYIKNVLPNIEFSDEQIQQAQEQIKNAVEAIFNLKPPEISIDVKIPEETKDLSEELIKPPNWEEFLKMADVLANKLQAANALVTDWYNSEIIIITNIYNALIEQEKIKAREVINAIIADIMSVNWAELGVNSGSGFGRGFYAGAREWIKLLAEEVAKYFEFHSPPEEGPLRETENWGAGFLKEFIRGLLSQRQLLSASLLQLFVPIDFYKYAANVIFRELTYMYVNMPVKTPFYEKNNWLPGSEVYRLLGLRKDRYLEYIFKDFDEYFKGKEIWETRYRYNVPTRVLMEWNRRFVHDEYEWTLANMFSEKTALQYTLEEYEFTEGRRVSWEEVVERFNKTLSKYGEFLKDYLRGDKPQDILNALERFLDEWAGEKREYMELTPYQFLKTKFGLLQVDYPQYNEMLKYWDKIFEQNKELEEKAFKAWYLMARQKKFQDKYFLIGQYIGKHPATEEGLIGQYMTTPALPLIRGILRSGWEDWMNIYLHYKYKELRYDYLERYRRGFPFLSEEGIKYEFRDYGEYPPIYYGQNNFRMNTYEIFDVFKQVFESVPREKGITFFTKLFEQAISNRKGLQKLLEYKRKFEKMSEEEIENAYHPKDYLKALQDRIQYALYFLIQQYGLTLEEIGKQIGEEKLKELYPDLGKIFLQPDYRVGTSGGLSGGNLGQGIVINLNFNIDNINDVNINDFVALVAEKMIEQLSKYIIL